MEALTTISSKYQIMIPRKVRPETSEVSKTSEV
jgi:bifunctional DNA-binding transcriptional regulator/antitoxin component of YhaV-PrlF toxin-antitoxin module